MAFLGKLYENVHTEFIEQINSRSKRQGLGAYIPTNIVARNTKRRESTKEKLEAAEPLNVKVPPKCNGRSTIHLQLKFPQMDQLGIPTTLNVRN